MVPLPVLPILKEAWKGALEPVLPIRGQIGHAAEECQGHQQQPNYLGASRSSAQKPKTKLTKPRIGGVQMEKPYPNPAS